MGNWRRRIGLGLVAAAILAALAWGFMPQPATVDTAQVTRGPLAVTVDEEGRTRVIDRFVISAPVAGFARRVELDVGDAVGGGGVLARLEPSPSEVLDPRTRAE
nr:efflux transporter periplasmic adaptor subunit [Gammaproteobacteria bacterium]